MTPDEKAAGSSNAANPFIQADYCSVRSRHNLEDPIGSAPGHTRYIFVEVPLPWSHNVEQSAHFPAGLNETLKHCTDQGCKFRLQAFCSESQSTSSGFTRVFDMRLTEQPRARYDKLEFVVANDRLNELVQVLLIDESRLPEFKEFAQPSTASAREIFVCTHGSHDQCCGKFGYTIYKEIEHQYTSSLENPIRVWRTSHIGGHRHAPTLIDFPEGRYWGQITVEVLDHVLLHKGDFSDIAGKYRGLAGIDAFSQVAERELFIREGWAWIDYHKQAIVLRRANDEARVRWEYKSQDGTRTGEYEVDVYISGTVVSSGCGSESSEIAQYSIREI